MERERALRAQFQRNADVLRRMLARVEKTGKPVNGYAAQELRVIIHDYECRARGERPSSWGVDGMEYPVPSYFWVD